MKKSKRISGKRQNELLITYTLFHIQLWEILNLEQILNYFQKKIILIFQKKFQQNKLLSLMKIF